MYRQKASNEYFMNLRYQYLNLILSRCIWAIGHQPPLSLFFTENIPDKIIWIYNLKRWGIVCIFVSSIINLLYLCIFQKFQPFICSVVGAVILTFDCPFEKEYNGVAIGVFWVCMKCKRRVWSFSSRMNQNKRWHLSHKLRSFYSRLCLFLIPH